MVNASAMSSLLLPILVLAIASLVRTTSAWSLWPYKHVHISNKLRTSNGVLHINCWNKNDDRLDRDVAVGEEFTWRFKPNIFVTRKWTCEVSTDDRRQVSFDSYWEDANQKRREHKENIYRVAEEGGIYLRVVQENREQYWAKWQIRS